MKEDVKKQPTNKKSYFFLGTNCAKNDFLPLSCPSGLFVSFFISFPCQSKSNNDDAVVGSVVVGLLLPTCEDVISESRFHVSVPDFLVVLALR